MRIHWVVFVLPFGLSFNAVKAEVRPATLFADHMMLQRDTKLPIWGDASSGEKVTVRIAGQVKEAIARDDGKWSLQLEPLKAGGPYELTIDGSNHLLIQDVLVGEVWVAGGQSNMDMRLSAAEGGDEAAASANDSQIRDFRVNGALPLAPTRELRGQWQQCTPDNAKDWSAAGYYFARDLRKSLDVPVGLLQNAVGWTPAEAWTSRDALLANPELKDIVDCWDRWRARYPHALELHQQKLTAWKAAADQAKAEGKPAPPEPQAPWNPQFGHHYSVHFNGMVYPLIPFAIRGAIWYQGETNASRADQYGTLFPTMIRDWRSHWGQGDFPFIFVQIAPLDAGPVDRAELRDAQRQTLALPNTAMVVTVDIGDAKDEHPKFKAQVGQRLALAAETLVYSKNVVAGGPLYKEMKVEGNAIRLFFTSIGSGLMAKHNAPLTGFTMAGDDQKFVPAEAKIDGESIFVSASSVTRPVAIRYAWANFPQFSLFNQAGLPASPFRTDDWPLTTKGDKRMLFEQIPLDEETLTQKQAQ